MGRADGVWVLRPYQGTLIRISGQIARSLSWSPDGRQLLALRSTGIDSKEDLVLFDMPARIS
ncbi:MAG: hypothetical protein NVSMB32_17570 [Actinomycetota bacterium]